MKFECNSKHETKKLSKRVLEIFFVSTVLISCEFSYLKSILVYNYAIWFVYCLTMELFWFCFILYYCWFGVFFFFFHQKFFSSISSWMYPLGFGFFFFIKKNFHIKVSTHFPYVSSFYYFSSLLTIHLTEKESGELEFMMLRNKIVEEVQMTENRSRY